MHCIALEMTNDYYYMLLELFELALAFLVLAFA